MEQYDNNIEAHINELTQRQDSEEQDLQRKIDLVDKEIASKSEKLRQINETIEAFRVLSEMKDKELSFLHEKLDMNKKRASESKEQEQKDKIKKDELKQADTLESQLEDLKKRFFFAWLHNFRILPSSKTNLDLLYEQVQREKVPHTRWQLWLEEKIFNGQIEW
eukprot:TRINITY_DN5555_c0_g1_i2.p1 TRINITY_DN5555_c0_g1~~TRINITY_DN5555_c0_g1_i2.p1  ORF type:complete len:164 (+),score=27.74 TRINITY_DN5555_c0_g1_i2:355-846(+)